MFTFSTISNSISSYFSSSFRTSTAALISAIVGSAGEKEMAVGAVTAAFCCIVSLRLAGSSVSRIGSTSCAEAGLDNGPVLLLLGHSRGDVRVEVVKATFFRVLPGLTSPLSRSMTSIGGRAVASVTLISVSGLSAFSTSTMIGTFGAE